MAEREWAVLNDAGASEEFAELFLEVARRARIEADAERLGVRAGTVVFEGAQGVLLDEWHGFHPYTTWSTTTFGNAMTLLKEAGFAGEIRRVGAMRGYMTRHGAGPFPTEDAGLTRGVPDLHNGDNPWQRQFRVGWLDLVLLRYALEVCGGADELAVTCLDRIGDWRVCTRYGVAGEEAFAGERLRFAPAPDLAHQEKLTRALLRCVPVYEDLENEEGLLETIEQSLKIRIGLTSRGPTWRDKMEVKGPQGARKSPAACGV